MDYSKTLNLPKTEFPMRGNLPQAEPKMQAWWKEINVYEKLKNLRAGQEKYILHDGPPFANGDIHIGHAMNKILKDMIVRSKSMQGYDTPFVPGWDTHGLPIEQAIANRGKVDRKKMSVLEFRQYCEQYAKDWIAKQKEQFMRLGVRADWENPYTTLDPEYEAQQIRVFGEMVKQGSIYKGLRPVYWSPSSESALAEAEIEYADKKSPSIFVAFSVADTHGKLPAETEFLIWTTTPWTLPANLGISVHPEYEYVVIEVQGRTLLLAQGLLESVAKTMEWKAEEVKIIQSIQGSELDRMTCKHPFYDRDSLVMLGEHVTLDAGTGCVHTAPGHGEDDFAIGREYGLEVLSPVDDRGHFTEEAPGFEGMFYDKANKVITDQLAESGKLLKLEFIEHQYPHDWRTKKPVIFRATEQWFASIDQFRAAMLEEIKKINWTPHWGEVRLHNMIADRGDWCISRQRAWGVPIPIFYCRNCNYPVVNEQTIEKTADLFAQYGSNVWFEKPAEELLPENTTCPECQHNEFRKETDIMDVWFDSGSSHVAVLETRDDLQYPADLYLEGSDQYRGWYNSSLITGVAVRGQAPYKAVLSHGFTLDEQGRKQSKSLGNTVDPLKVCGNLGADILRLWVASVDYQSDVRISDNILRQTSEAYRKIRNTLRFLLGNLADFDPKQHRVNPDQMHEIDRYALIRLHRRIEQVVHAYNNYDFHHAYQSIHHFCAVEMSAFYLDIMKDRLYVELADNLQRRATQTVLYDVLLVLTKLISPILPHTADEVWRFIPGVDEESVQLTQFPVENTSLYDEVIESKWTQLDLLRDEVLKGLEQARQDKIIGNALEAELEIYPDEKSAELFAQFTEQELEMIFIVSKVKICNQNELPDDALKLAGIAVKVLVADGGKCDRCWMIKPEVVESEETLCDRCSQVMQSMS